MRVTLVDRRVRREKIKVLVALDVPDPDSLATAQHHVERVIVVGAVVILQADKGTRLGVRHLHDLSSGVLTSLPGTTGLVGGTWL